MVLNYIKEEKLDYLKGNIKSNIEKGNYHKNEDWIKEYLGQDFFLESDILLNKFQLIIPQKQGTETDLENCKILYTSMKNLTVEQATEERIWTYLTHVTFWSYMRNRWPIDEKNESSQSEFIRTRYCFMNNADRALVRNGISRLWWIAYSTYDETLEDPFYLTGILLRDSDLQVSILERCFSRNGDLTRNILKAIDKYTSKNGFPSRKQRRKLIKDINTIGGMKLLDMLDYTSIEEIVENSLKEESNIENIA